MPFLTIGIASYNYASYLPKAFEQIKKQKFKDFEVLYCDDGSSDDSVQVIERFIKDNPDMNIRLIKAENKGLLANKNRIIENAQGEYLLICDADDYMADDCLEVLCEAAQEQRADCVIGGFSEIDSNGNAYKTHVPEENANKWIFIWHHAQIYKMDLIREHGICFKTLPDDVCYIQRIHQYAKKTVFVSKDVYYWMRHSDSTSRAIDNESPWHPRKIWGKIVDCMLEIEEGISDEDEIWGMRYFLYKWFYFNIMDLPVNQKQELRENIKQVQSDMKRICPRYRKIGYIIKALRQEDTFFAKSAIFACWLVEGFGCIAFLPVIRNKQYSLRA